MDLQTLFIQKHQSPSDINEHLPILNKLATKVNHITEFGTRHGDSTIAILAGIDKTNKQLVSYDLFKSNIVNQLETMTQNFKFIQADTLTIEINQTDFLFIDTLHTYYQLYSELIKHSKNVTTYIALHDTVSYGENDEPFYDSNSEVRMSQLIQKTEKQGLKIAINDFLDTEDGKNWFIGQTFENNNGLTILKRK